MHVHTERSYDSVNSIGDIEGRCRESSLDGYAVCDHDTIVALADVRVSSKDVVVIPGLEVTAKGAHILCLDPSELVPAGLSIAETVERIHGQGATAVLAHPYAIPRSYVSFKEVKVAGFDIIEVTNASQVPFKLVEGWNRLLAEKLGLPQTGGSDSHIPETVGRAYTVVDSASRDPEDVIDAIRKGRTSVFGSGTRLLERLEKLWRIIQKG